MVCVAAFIYGHTPLDRAYSARLFCPEGLPGGKRIGQNFNRGQDSEFHIHRSLYDQQENLTFIRPSFTQDKQITSTKMGDPVLAVRYIKSQLIFYTLLLLLYMQQEPSLHVTEANTKVDRCSNAAPTLGKGNRRGRQNSESSTSRSDPIESLVNPETLANGEGQLIGPAAARELDKRNKKKQKRKMTAA